MLLKAIFITTETWSGTGIGADFYTSRKDAMDDIFEWRHLPLDARIGAEFRHRVV
jgi:hypothetical protein